MQANLLGFVGFTRQERDILDAREAATITEYLRLLLVDARDGLIKSQTGLQAHVADEDDPHHTGKSKSFLNSLYRLLYQYYTELSTNPVSFTEFVALANTPVWLDFVRRLLVNHRLYQIAQAQGSPALPVSVDLGTCDPNDDAQTTTSAGFSSIDDFFSNAGKLSGWAPRSTANNLGLTTVSHRPVLYARRGLPFIATSDQSLSDFLSITDIDLTAEAYPLHIGLRVGRGIAPEAGPVDLCAITTDAGIFTITYDPVSRGISVIVPIDDMAAVPAMTAPTGVFWITLDQTSLRLSAQGPQSGISNFLQFETTTLGAVKSFSLLQDIERRGYLVNLLSVAVFAGISSLDDVYAQNSYL